MARDIDIESAEVASLNAIWRELVHTSVIFPEDSDETVTLTAGAVANAWLAWTEIADNNAVKFSSKIADYIGHISYLIVEKVSVNDVVYMVEIAYGSAKTVVGVVRFYGGAVPKQAQRMHAPLIPAGETAYYRMKCETGGSTAEVHLRYHLHT